MESSMSSHNCTSSPPQDMLHPKNPFSGITYTCPTVTACCLPLCSERIASLRCQHVNRQRREGRASGETSILEEGGKLPNLMTPSSSSSSLLQLKRPRVSLPARSALRPPHLNSCCCRSSVTSLPLLSSSTSSSRKLLPLLSLPARGALPALP